MSLDCYLLVCRFVSTASYKHLKSLLFIQTAYKKRSSLFFPQCLSLQITLSKNVILGALFFLSSIKFILTFLTTQDVETNFIFQIQCRIK
jgi:hypothetical protein